MTDEPYYIKHMNEFYYYIGLIAADGYLTRYGVGIDLKDHDVLVKMHRYFNTNEPRIHGSLMRVLLSDDRVNALARNYLRLPRKDSMCLPDIPRKYFNSFLLGYFDGDGSATLENNGKGCIRTRISIRGPHSFLVSMRSLYPIGTVYYRDKCSQWVVSNRHDVATMTKYMYRNNNVFIKRKYGRLVSATGLVIDQSKTLSD